jgi:hypothetical protein
MYKPRDSKTPPLFNEPFSLGGELNRENRWLTLAAVMDWEAIEEVYMRHFSRMGRPAKDARLVCGLLIVKWLEGFSDERTVTELRENPYVQAFCGLPAFVTDESAADSSLLSRARRKMGKEGFASFEADLGAILAKHDVLKQKFARKSDAKKSPGLLDSAGDLLEKIGRSLFKDE